MYSSIKFVEENITVEFSVDNQIREKKSFSKIFSSIL